MKVQNTNVAPAKSLTLKNGFLLLKIKKLGQTECFINKLRVAAHPNRTFFVLLLFYMHNNNWGKGHIYCMKLPMKLHSSGANPPRTRLTSAFGRRDDSSDRSAATSIFRNAKSVSGLFENRRLLINIVDGNGDIGVVHRSKQKETNDN